MLETINDYISFIALILTVIFSLRFFIAAFNNSRDIDNSKFSIINDYADNEDD